MCLIKPKRIKYIKKHRKSSRLRSTNARFILKSIKTVDSKNAVTLVASRSILVDREQLISAFNAAKRVLLRQGIFSVKVTCDHPFSSKGVGARMGKGKGSVGSWRIFLKKGSSIFCVSGVDPVVARNALVSCSKKLPIPTAVINFKGSAKAL